MPRFYFDVVKDDPVEDGEGVELPDPIVARAYAVLAARDLACASILEGELNFGFRIVVLDEDRTELFSVALRDAFTVVTDPSSD